MKTMSRFVRDTVSPNVRLVARDQAAGYQKLHQAFPHEHVDHKAHECERRGAYKQTGIVPESVLCSISFVRVIGYMPKSKTDAQMSALVKREARDVPEADVDLDALSRAHT